MQNPNAPFSPEVKRQAVRDLYTCSESARNIAQGAGVSRQVLYKWKDEVIGDEAYSGMRKHSIPSADEEIDALRSERNKLLQEIRQLQMEHDILKKADEIIKKVLEQRGQTTSIFAISYPKSKASNNTIAA